MHCQSDEATGGGEVQHRGDQLRRVRGVQNGVGCGEGGGGEDGGADEWGLRVRGEDKGVGGEGGPRCQRDTAAAEARGFEAARAPVHAPTAALDARFLPP